MTAMEKFELVFYAFILVMLFGAIQVFGNEEKCAWVTCIGHTQNTSAICTKLGEGQIGSEFIQFVQKETGHPGETVTIECVDKAKDYLVVPQLAGSVRMGK